MDTSNLQKKGLPIQKGRPCGSRAVFCRKFTIRIVNGSRLGGVSDSVNRSFQVGGTRFDTLTVAHMSLVTASAVRQPDGLRDRRFVLISGLVFSLEMSENRAVAGGNIS
jgi:hypothetical protein